MVYIREEDAIHFDILFSYDDGDNNRVKGTAGGVTTVYIGNYYEVAGATIKKYYYAGSQRITMRWAGTLYWLLNNREPPGRGSTGVTASGTTETGEVRYYPFGADRFISGTTPTSFKYTLALSLSKGPEVG